MMPSDSCIEHSCRYQLEEQTTQSVELTADVLLKI